MKRLRLIDVLNFLWATLHDFVYVGIAAGAYWLWHQPTATRNNLLLVVIVAAIFLLDAVINYRQHAKLDKRLDRLEAVHHIDDEVAENAARAATPHRRWRRR